MYTVSVSISSNDVRKSIVATSDTSIRQCFAEAGIDCSRAMVMLDYETIDELDATLADYEVGETAILTAVRKADNANA